MNPAIFDRPSGAGALLGPGDIATPTAGYSLRYLSINYFGQPVVRVRKDVVGNPEQYFTPSQLTDGTLATFLGANDGFVSRWYDQFGSNDAVQTTAAEQPKIWDASTGLVTENGRPAVHFDGVDDELSLAGYSIVTTLNEVASFLVFKQNSTGQSSGVLNLGSSSDDTRFYVPRLLSGIRLGYGDNQSLINSGIDDTNQHLVSAYTDSTNIKFKVDDLFTGSSPIQNVTITNFISQEIGRISNEFDGKVQEIIIYNNDQSANRTKIEDNINDYYDIY